MKKNMKKVLYIIMIMACIFAFAGCNKESGDDTSTTENTNETSDDKSSDLVVKIGDIKVNLDEMMVYVGTFKFQYESMYGAGIWSADLGGYTFEDMAKDSLMEQISYIKINNDKAKDLNITLTDEEKTETEELADEYIKSAAESGIEGIVTKELMQNIYMENYIAQKVYEHEVKDIDTNVSDEEAKQITVQHLLIKTTDSDENGNLVDLPEDEQEAILKKAEELLEQAKTTEDFEAFAQENTADSGVEYTFGRGKMDTAFEEASFALKSGELSGLVKSVYGYHIIYCVSDYNAEATETAKNDIITQRQQNAFGIIFEQWKEEYPIEYNDIVWNAVAFSSSNTEDSTEETVEETSEEVTE